MLGDNGIVLATTYFSLTLCVGFLCFFVVVSVDYLLPTSTYADTTLSYSQNASTQIKTDKKQIALCYHHFVEWNIESTYNTAVYNSILYMYISNVNQTFKCTASHTYILVSP